LSKLGTLKSQRALAVRYHGAGSPQARDAAEKLAAEKTAVYIKRLLAAAPRLSDQQRNDLAELLRPVRRRPADADAQPVIDADAQPVIDADAQPVKKQKPRARRDRGAA
jgi:hypothetical protein